jgi:hypothetical protein
MRLTSRRATTSLPALLLASALAVAAATGQVAPAGPDRSGTAMHTAPPEPLFALTAEAVNGLPPAAQDTLPAQGLPDAGGGKKSVGLAVIYSLLLPGMGELYAGDYSSGKFFTGADGVLWLSLYAVDAHANSIQDDARTYAALHAGFDPAGKDDEYYSDVGNFNDVYAFNEQVLRDRDAYKLYDPTSPDYWKWDAESNREVYRGQRVEADGMFNNTRFVVAGLLANRVLSAINAARIVIAGNNAAGGGEVGIGATILGGPVHAHGIALSITRAF